MSLINGCAPASRRSFGVPALDPENSVIAVVSFEGPDRYSQAGGLGVRVTGLVHSLAGLGFETHLFFIGDPALPPVERVGDGRLVLHRWSQWISANCRRGVYDGELAKVADLTASLPPVLIDQVVQPALAAGKIPILLFEEWQTAACVSRVSGMLSAAAIRDRTLVAWNANHCYGFERIDWSGLATAAMITTVSRHMRSIVRACGADARVIPNGIPESALEPVARREVSAVRAATSAHRDAGLCFKMARWEREKGWAQALDAVTHLRDRARPMMLVARSGGPSGSGGELAHDAEARGLRLVSFDSEAAFVAGLGDGARDGADVVNLRFGVSASLARTLYAASDGVLANSVSEPFGLVGLEAMAAGGVAYTGGTGEDYAIAGRNAIVLETLDPGEIIRHWEELASSPETVSRLRREARKTAREYEWRSVIAILIDALERQAHRRGLIAGAVRDITSIRRPGAARADDRRRPPEHGRGGARGASRDKGVKAPATGPVDLPHRATWPAALSGRERAAPARG
ncbi:MAG TPA: glycosyltransferase [Gemmatimonadaceae bacterium]|nr:glycosyltransferase [Gemmatimonadaceae bacterium]